MANSLRIGEDRFQKLPRLGAKLYDSLTRMLDGLSRSARPLVVIDSYELISAVGASLRRTILDATRPVFEEASTP